MMSDLIQTLLHKRGITETDAIEKFLKPDYARDVHDPFLLNDMEKAVARVFSAIEREEKIAIYGDFDCDGIPGASVLYDFFAKIGYSNIEVYIPHRDREGYGFHSEAVDKLHKQGVALIITVDVGGAAVQTVAHANELGVDVIICDHHEPIREPAASNGPGVTKIPAAVAVVSPKLGNYPFRDLCGAAVAWKLVCALLQRGKSTHIPVYESIPEGWEKWLLDLVAIATVADLVPLVGENRALAHFGLTVLRKTPRPGVRALCTSAHVRQSEITEDDIGFSFAPRINAASRMDEPEIALRLLTTKDADEAEKCAAHLESLNRKRKGVVAAIVREAKSRARTRFTVADKVIVLGDVEWKPALMGLAANSLMEDRGGVVLMWGRDANGKLKGSARSDGSLSVVELFAQSGAFEEFGGHHASGGFTVSHEAVHTLHESLARAAEALQESAKEVVIAQTDADLSLAQVTSTLLQELSQLAPFGMGNPKPLFRVRSARITFARQFGKEMNHTEVTLACPESGVSQRAFQFFKTPTDFTLAPSPGTLVDMLATVEKDSFKGPDRLALRIADILEPRS